MNSKLIKILNDQDETEFRILCKAIGIAQQVRNFCREYQIPIELLAERMGMNTQEVNQFRNGTHIYDIKTISKFETVMIEVREEMEKASAENNPAIV